MLSFSPNLTLLYTELEFGRRFAIAADDGFETVDYWPYEDSAVALRAVRATGQSVGVLAADPGPAGEHGRLAHTDQVWSRLLFDAYHLEQNEPPVSALFERVRDNVGHVPLADVPGRGEPGHVELRGACPNRFMCVRRSRRRH